MSKDIVTDLVRIAVRRAEMAKADAPRILACARAGKNEYGQLGNYAFLQSAYMLGYLFNFNHPQNSLHGQAWCAELATTFTDHVSQYFKAAQPAKSVTAEWNPLGTVELFALMKPDGKRRADWLEFIEGYIAYATEQPFGFTSPNHDAWRELFLYRAGQILDRPKLCEMGLFLCRQELTYQTPEGFWEEGKHHGPSMTYSTLMLEPLAHLSRHTHDPEITAATRRLATFMASWCFPDGCAIGAFDGRQSTGFAFGLPVCPGLELTPTGRSLNARGLSTFERLDLSTRSVRGSEWYDHFFLFHCASALHYYTELVPAEERKAVADDAGGLPVDADGVRENHSPTFDGLLARKGKWSVALSSQNSDIPRQAAGVFRLERASRIELWHADARLVLGGGHNRNDWPIPYANAILDTGFAGETSFGWVQQNKSPKRRAYYLPSWTESKVSEGRPELALHFAHGTVRFRMCVESDTELRIEASWNIRHVKRLCLQIPLVVWRGAQVWADGEALKADPATPLSLKHSLETRGGPMGGRVTLSVPAGVPAQAHYPLPPLRYYMEPAEPDPTEPLFYMALVSSQWDEPPETGMAAWTVAVQ